MFTYLFYRAQTKYQIVLTKTDMVFPIDLARHAMRIEEVTIVQFSVALFVRSALSHLSCGANNLLIIIMILQSLKAHKSVVQPVVWSVFVSLVFRHPYMHNFHLHHRPYSLDTILVPDDG